jgi:hypothetical protein
MGQAFYLRLVRGRKSIKHLSQIDVACCLQQSNLCAVVLNMIPIEYNNNTGDRWFQSKSVCGEMVIVFGKAKTAIVGDNMSQNYTI